MNSLLHPPLLSGGLRALLWLLVLASPFAAWALCRRAGAERDGRWASAALPVGHAALALGLLLVLLRLVEWILAPEQTGPLAWMDAGLLRFAPTLQQRPWNPLDALLAFALLLALLFPLLALGARALLGERGRGAFRVPLGTWVAAVCGLAALGTLLWVDMAFRSVGRDPVLLDLLAAAPLTAAALFVWSFSARREEAAPAPRRQAPREARRRVDPPACWRQMQALGAKDAPFAHAPARRLGGGDPWCAAAWADAGAQGAPPEALDELVQSWQRPDRGWLVGDLAHPGDSVFVVAALLLALRKEGLRCLVVSEEAAALRDALRRALRARGGWTQGPLVAGLSELQEQVAGQSLPAAVFLDVEELSTEGIRMLSAPGTEGARFCRNIGLVVLPKVDHGAPLQVNHRFFTLRRLGLALRAASARCSLLATGLGGAASRTLVERAFPGLAVRELPFGSRSSLEVHAWRAHPAFTAAPGNPWVERALTPLVQEGATASIGDPGGRFDRSSRSNGAELVRSVSMAGLASASALDAAWLIAAFRALPNRVPLAGEPWEAHHTLWGLGATPITRFLVRDPRNLPGLQQQGQLPPPRPLVAYQNRLLAQAHLEAACREGVQDLESLRGLFGSALVEQVVGPKEAQRFAWRTRPGGTEPVRTALLPQRGDGRRRLRRTITDRSVRVVDKHGGRLLAEEDEVLAVTRFYPLRVLAFADTRYQVPLHAWDAKREELLIETVPDHRPLTRPLLAIRLLYPELVEAVQERSGAVPFRVATFEATAEERVSGVVDAQGARTLYDPVRATYRTRVRGIYFPAARPSEAALFHLACSLDDVLLAHLLAADDDIHVVPAPAGFAGGLPAGLHVVDRHVQGIGVAEALDLELAGELLRWVRSLLATCPCAHGCDECTPAEALHNGPDKDGVLQILGG